METLTLLQAAGLNSQPCTVSLLAPAQTHKRHGVSGPMMISISCQAARTSATTENGSQARNSALNFHMQTRTSEEELNSFRQGVDESCKLVVIDIRQTL